MKKYRLLKNLPDVKAGAIFSDDGLGWYSLIINETKINYPITAIENNPEWFEKIKNDNKIKHITLNGTAPDYSDDNIFLVQTKINEIIDHINKR